MVKGRQAARASARQNAEATNTIVKLKEDFAAATKMYDEHVSELRAEIEELRNQMREEATTIAMDEVIRLTAEKEEETARRSACEEKNDELAWRKDVLVYNTCKYLSMSLGLDVAGALGMISTWMLDKDYDSPLTVDMLVENGLPHDGWACMYTRASKNLIKSFHGSLRSGENSMFLELGNVEKLRPDTIHRMYNPDLYLARPDLKKRKVIPGRKLPPGMKASKAALRGR